MTRLKTKVIRVLIFLKTLPKASQILIVLQCLVESSPARGFSEVNNVKEREREKKMSFSARLGAQNTFQ